MNDEAMERRAREADRRAGLALTRYHLSRDAVALAFRLGENDVFRIDDPQQGSFALRLHKPGYQEPPTIASELAWLAALAAEGVPVAEPVAGTDGALLQRAGDDEAAPCCVLFPWIEAAPATERDPLHTLVALGAASARIHRHGRTWQPPEGFRRQRWDHAGLIGDGHIHGSFRRTPGIPADKIPLFEEAEAKATEAIGRLKEDPRHGWGLIHGDFSVANAVIAAEGPVIIDFDDCGWGWPVYDIAVCLWHLNEPDRFALLRDTMLAGYESVLPFPGEQYACLDAAIMAQHLGNLGWYAKHADTPAARRLPQRIAATEAAARRYLGRGG